MNFYPIRQNWGITPCYIRTAKYQDNDALAVQLITKEGEPYATISVNVEFYSDLLPDDMFVFKDYSENTGIYESLLEAGVIEDCNISVQVSQFVQCPVVRLVKT